MLEVINCVVKQSYTGKFTVIKIKVGLRYLWLVESGTKFSYDFALQVGRWK